MVVAVVEVVLCCKERRRRKGNKYGHILHMALTLAKINSLCILYLCRPIKFDFLSGGRAIKLVISLGFCLCLCLDVDIDVGDMIWYAEIIAFNLFCLSLG